MHSLLLLLLCAAVHAIYRTDSELAMDYGTPVALPPPRYLSLPPSSLTGTTLRAAGAARGLFMGAAINEGLWPSAEPYASTFLREYSLATCENCCKFAELEGTQNEFTFTACDFIANVSMVQNTGGVFRGHNFVWGPYNPSWIATLDGPGRREAMQNHISTALSHYASLPLPAFTCWDVVNEAVSDSPGILWKVNNWTISGEGVPGGYVENAFRFAKAALPAGSPTRLWYNDYSAEAAGSVKGDKVYGMLKDMLSRGVPITGVGLQMHISVDAYPDPWAVSANIQRLGELGLEVHITEADVRCTACSAERLSLQAAVYGHMLAACLNNSGVCKSFETWGIT